MDINAHVKCDTKTTPIVENDVMGNGKVTDNDIRRINPNDDIRNADGYGDHR